MKLDDAPLSGWYPDPVGGSRLRWWDGTDWTDDRRAPPTPSEFDSADRQSVRSVPPAADIDRPTDGRIRSADAEQIVSQVRHAAREEVSRAADIFSQRATSAIRAGSEVLGGYASLFFRIIKLAIVVAATVVIVWFILQFLAQATLFEWIGDRIDNAG